MRALPVFIVLLLALPFLSIAREPAYSSSVASPQSELGKWWKNSEIVKELQLSEKQVSQIEESYLNHRKWLVSLVGELKHLEDRLETLMQAEYLDDREILAQAELVGAARARLEKGNASMMLSIRKALTAEQWKRMEEIQDLRSTSSALILRQGAAASSSVASNATIAGRSSTGKVYSVGNGVKLPVALYKPMPPYTQAAKKAGAEGILLLQVVVRKDGRVDSPKVLRGIGYGLDESAIRTIMEEWRFQPGTLNGQPVDVQANMEVTFRLY